jgi:predicted transcriptional regulator
MVDENNELRELVAEVAAAYFSNAHVNASDIPTVIQQIASSLSAIGGGQFAEPAQADETRRVTPAQARKSITPNGLISFEDGKSYKTLKRHLAGKGLTPAQYREKHGLPADYPMVAPNYSAARSAMALSLGLGRKGAAARASKSAGGPKRGPGRPKNPS